jgi:hypothetical protein
LRQVRDGCRGDVAAPRIFQCHRDAHVDAEVAGLFDFCQAAQFADLEVDDVHGEFGFGAEEDAEIVDGFIEHERVRDLSSNSKAFLVGEAGLFDVNIHVADGLGDADGFVLHPTGIGVGHKAVAGLEFCGDGLDAGDIHIGIAADFELEAAIAFRAVARDFRRHLLGGFLRDGAVKGNVLAITTAEQFADGQARGLAENIPAGYVDAALHVGMALERRVHGAIEFQELARVFAEQLRTKLAQTSAHALRIRRQVKRTERADFAMADQGVATDQRGVARPQGAACDVGAFEVQVNTCDTPVVTITGPASGSVFAANTEVTFTGSFSGGNGPFTAQWIIDSNVVAGVVDQSAKTVTATVTFGGAGVYQVQLSVANACGNTGTADTVDGLLGRSRSTH